MAKPQIPQAPKSPPFIDPVTGKKAKIGTRTTIIEAYKDVKVESLLNQDINNRLKNNNILRFY